MSEGFPSRASRHQKQQADTNESEENNIDEAPVTPEIDEAVDSSSLENTDSSENVLRNPDMPNLPSRRSLPRPDSNDVQEESKDSSPVADDVAAEAAKVPQQPLSSSVGANGGNATQQRRGELSGGVGGPVKKRKTWLIVLVAVIVVALIGGAAWYYFSGSKQRDAVSMVGLPAGVTAEQVVTTADIVNFHADVDSAEKQEEILNSLMDSWTLEGENTADSTQRIYSFSKDDVNMTVILSNPSDGTYRVAYAVAGKGIGGQQEDPSSTPSQTPGNETSPTPTADPN